MLNKRVMRHRPFVVLGDFWLPVLDRVREVEAGPHAGKWGEAAQRLVLHAGNPADAAALLARFHQDG
jgi:hypothetical protein